MLTFLIKAKESKSFYHLWCLLVIHLTVTDYFFVRLYIFTACSLSQFMFDRCTS